jgi:hypothetical protein
MSDPGLQIEQEIIKLTHARLEAVRRRDRAALEQIIADDFLIAGWLPDGQLGDKQTYIEDCLRPVEVEQGTYSCERWQFRKYDHIVIANYIFKWHALVNGKEWGGMALITSVWANKDGSWQLVVNHSSMVPSPQD